MDVVITIQQLPIEILTLILEKLDDRTTRYARLTNTQWFNLCKYWRFTIFCLRESDVEAVCDRMLRYQWPIEITLCKPFMTVANHVEHFNKLTNLIGLDLAYLSPAHHLDYYLALLTNLTQLHHLRAPGGFEGLRGYYPNLTELKLLNDPGVRRSMTDAAYLSTFTKLQSLKLGCTISSPTIFEHIPNPSLLTSLTLAMRQTKYHGANLPQTFDYENATRLVNLKELILLFRGGEIDWPSMTSLESLHVQSAEKLAHLNFPNLTYLDVKRIKTDSKHWTNMALLTKLTHLSLIDSDVNDDNMTFLTRLTDLSHLCLSNQGDFSEMLSYIQSTKLTFLDVFLRQGHARAQDSINYIARLTNLRHLGFIDYPDYSGSFNLTQVAIHLTNLQSLKVTLDEWDPRELSTLTSLTQLRIFKKPNRLLPTLPNLEDFEGERLTADDWLSIGQYSKLTKLVAVRTSSRVDYKYLKDLPLRYLDVNGVGTEALTNLTDLHTLNAQQLDEKDMEYLSVLPNLTQLGRASSHHHWQSVTKLTALLHLELSVKPHAVKNCEKLLSHRLAYLSIHARDD